MQTTTPKTPISAEIIFGTVIIATLWCAGTVLYNAGENDGRQHEIIRAADDREEADRQYFTSLMSNCISNGGVPFGLQSEKSLNEVCGCANTKIKEQAVIAGMSLSDYHGQQVSASMEKEIYQGCV